MERTVHAFIGGAAVLQPNWFGAFLPPHVGYINDLCRKILEQTERRLQYLVYAKLE